MKGGALKILFSDSGANDSDKEFTAPAGAEWHIDDIHVLLATTATAGNRFVTVEVRGPTGDDTVYKRFNSAAQAASLTQEREFAAGAPREGVADNYALAPLPSVGLIVPPTFRVRVYDRATVDAAADDMTVTCVGREVPVV